MRTHTPISVESVHVASLCLPADLVARLARAGILTVEDLANTTESELLHLRGVGRKSIKQIMGALSRLGLRLAPRTQKEKNLPTDAASPACLEDLAVTGLMAGDWLTDHAQRATLVHSLISMRRIHDVPPFPAAVRAIERMLPTVREIVSREWNERAATAWHDRLVRFPGRATGRGARKLSFLEVVRDAISSLVTDVDLLARNLTANGFAIRGSRLSAEDTATCVGAWAILSLALMDEARDLERGRLEMAELVADLLFPGAGRIGAGFTSYRRVQVDQSDLEELDLRLAGEAMHARDLANSLLSGGVLSAEEHRLLLATICPADDESPCPLPTMDLQLDAKSQEQPPTLADIMSLF
jgi:DNA-directed RNA polymerase subunit alpha